MVVEEEIKMDSSIVEVVIKTIKIIINLKMGEAFNNKINHKIKTRSNKITRPKCADIFKCVSFYIYYIIKYIKKLSLLIKYK
jgi:hypothetical protein